MEEWRAVPGYSGYWASSEGRVKSSRKVLTPSLGNHKYLVLRMGGGRPVLLLHRIIAMSFLGPCPRGYEVSHTNQNRTDNRVANLRYLSVADHRALDCNKPATLVHEGTGEKHTAPSRKALAAKLGIAARRVSDLLNGKRPSYEGYVTLKPTVSNGETLSCCQ